MPSPLLPEYVGVGGAVPVEDTRDQHIRSLEQQIRELHQRLRTSEQEIVRERNRNAHALGALRRTLSPLYGALQQVFAELDDIAPGESSPSVDERTRKVWDSWKSKLPAQAKVIDALLLHGEMNTQQLAIAVGLHRTTIPSHIYKLNQAGLINKNGGKFSLKEI